MFTFDAIIWKLKFVMETQKYHMIMVPPILFNETQNWTKGHPTIWFCQLQNENMCYCVFISCEIKIYWMFCSCTFIVIPMQM